MRFFKDMKFWKKVTLICGIPLLLISMLIGAMSYTRAKDTARSSSKLSLYDAVNRMDISLTTRSRQIISSVEAIAEGLLSADALELPASHLRDICLGLVAPFQEVQAVTVIWEGQPVYRSEPLPAPVRPSHKSPHCPGPGPPGRWCGRTFWPFPKAEMPSSWPGNCRPPMAGAGARFYCA